MTHIKVLQHHIDFGVRGNAFLCPIALAVHEQYPNVEKVVVGTSIYVDEVKLGPTPSQALEFMCAFDRERLVVPFEFDLE